MQMSKMMIQPRLDYFKMIHGVSRRIIDQMPEDKLNFKPVPEVRSWSETVQHMYGSLDAMMKRLDGLGLGRKVGGGEVFPPLLG